jgi:phosphoribosyl-ATP pyrophosphohydrolase/phosphoribosyl-AMP cyclohydrolase
VLLKVQPDGPACHTGATSCFFHRLEAAPQQYDTADNGARVLDELFALVKDRQQAMPQGSYTTRLFQEGVPRIAQKVIEEAGETAIAAVQGDKASLPNEVADLLYHTLVLLAASGVGPSQVWEVLRRRRQGSPPAPP